MPPKYLSATKRKASSSADEGDAADASRSQSKRSKVSKPLDSPSHENAQPTNKVLPVNISFPHKIPSTLRLATWNVCGLAASQKKVCLIEPVIYNPQIICVRDLNII